MPEHTLLDLQTLFIASSLHSPAMFSKKNVDNYKNKFVHQNIITEKSLYSLQSSPESNGGDGDTKIVLEAFLCVIVGFCGVGFCGVAICTTFVDEVCSAAFIWSILEHILVMESCSTVTAFFSSTISSWHVQCTAVCGMS